MAASEHAKPISRREDAVAIVDRLVDAGHVAYFAGGCVRDTLSGLEPKDFDVATSATPDQIRRLFPRSQGVGQAFGVLLVREGRSIIELATFRADGSYTDGRRPDDVRFATPEEDARRRDFTINGLFYDPIADRTIDYVGGVADLRAGTLRAIGDASHRFAEDYLRLLRAARFAARFGLTIEPATRAAILAHAYKLPRIAPERICDELRAMFAPPATRARAAALLDELGLTPILLRQLITENQFAGEHGAAALPDRLLFATVAAEPAASFPLLLVAFALDAMRASGQAIDGLLADAQRVGHALRNTFRLSNDESAAIDGILGVRPFLVGAVPRVATMKRFLARATSPEARRLLRAIAAGGEHAERIAWLDAQFNGFDAATIAPAPLVNGLDLQRAGHRPGPMFKVVLDAAYDAQLEGRVITRDGALKFAEECLRDDREGAAP